MKSFRILALSGVCLPALSTHAFADPVSIGSWVISSLLSVGAGGILPAVSAAAIGNVVIGAALIGASLLQSVLGRAPKINPGDFKSTFETGDSSEIRAVGRVRLGGLKAFGNTKDGRDRYRLICHTRGKVTAVEQHFLGGREVTVETDGQVSSPPWTKPGGSWVWIKNKIGDGTETAWTDLLSAFPDLWSPDHRVRGIAQSLIKYVSPGFGSTEDQEKFQKLYQSGAPDYERVQRSEPVYDPRSGQSATDQSTWAYRDNGPLCGAHILRSYPSLKVSDFDYAGIATEATKGDALVATLTGTEPRSRCWGMWTSETPRGDVMDQVLKSIGAEIVPSDENSFVLRLIDDVREPEIVFPERHLLDLQYRSGPESVERPNICRIKYYAPERNYEMTEIDLTGIAWAREQDEIDRVGEQYMDVELPFCPSASQAQRIGRRLFALARADVGVATFNMVGLAAWGKTMGGIPLPDIGVTETCAIGTPRVNDEEGTVEIPFVVWPDLAPWDPVTMEAPAPPVVPEMAYESDLDTPAAPAAASVVQYPDTSYETRLKFTAVTGGTIAEAVYRTYHDGEPDPFARLTNIYSGSGATRYGYQAVDASGAQADFKVRFFNAEEDGSYYSPLLFVIPMAIDNTQPPPPVFDLVGDTEVSTAAMNAARVLVQRQIDLGVPGPWTDILDVNIRPDQKKVFDIGVSAGSGDTTVNLRAYVFTSNGTASAAATATIIIPGTGPHG